MFLTYLSYGRTSDAFMSRACEVMLLAFVIAIGNWASAEKVNGDELLLPIGFDARIMGKRVGQPVLLLLFSAIYACGLFMLTTFIVGLLLYCTCRDSSQPGTQKVDKSFSNDKDNKRVQVFPTNRGKVLTETFKRHEAEPRNESKQKDEGLWLAVQRVSGPSGFVCD